MLMMIGIALMVVAVVLGVAWTLSLSKTRGERMAVLCAFASLVVFIVLFVVLVLVQQQRDLGIPLAAVALVVPTLVYLVVGRLAGGGKRAVKGEPVAADQSDAAARNDAAAPSDVSEAQKSSATHAPVAEEHEAGATRVSMADTAKTQQETSGRSVSAPQSTAGPSTDSEVGGAASSMQPQMTNGAQSSSVASAEQPLADKAAAADVGMRASGEAKGEMTPPAKVAARQGETQDALQQHAKGSQSSPETPSTPSNGGVDGAKVVRATNDVAERAATERIAAQRLEAARRAQAEREAAAAERAAGQRREAADKVSEQAEAQRLAALRQAQEARIAAERKMAAERAAAEQAAQSPVRVESSNVQVREAADSSFVPERYFMRATLLRDRGLFVAAAKLYAECASLSNDDETYRRATIEQIACYVKGGMGDQARELASALKDGCATLTMGERIKVDAVLKLAEQQ